MWARLNPYENLFDGSLGYYTADTIKLTVDSDPISQVLGRFHTPFYPKLIISILVLQYTQYHV